MFLNTILCLLAAWNKVEATTPVTPITTIPPLTTLPPSNEFYSGSAASKHRKDKKLDVKPFAVFNDVSVVQCLGLCIQRQTASKEKSCRAFNYNERTCYMLNTFVCDGERDLTDAPGYKYFDLVDDYSKEEGYMKTKQCAAKGKCSSRCLKFRLYKLPMSWHEAHAACKEEQAYLAMPRSRHDHETLIKMMKKDNILQSWIGIKRQKGVFYYDNGDPLLQNKTFWGPDQPNDSGGVQHCVQMMDEMEYMWNDFECSRPLGFFCQYVW